jgi:hypothetical protein
MLGWLLSLLGIVIAFAYVFVGLGIAIVLAQVTWNLLGMVPGVLVLVAGFAGTIAGVRPVVGAIESMLERFESY